jgi:hypothetical protein
MRFATATALLLTQVLPTVTQETPENSQNLDTTSLRANAGASAGPSPLVLHDFEQVVTRKFHNARKLKNKSQIKPCDPESDNLDVGILSCGMSRYCVESDESPLGGRCVPSLKKAPTLKASGQLLGGRLKNKNRAKAMECNPSTEFDVGILVCGTSQYCKEDVDSLLGGFCVSQATIDEEMHFSRRVQDDFFSGNGTVEYKFALTPEFLCTHPDFRCVCDDFDMTAGTGSFPCTLYEDVTQPCTDIVYSLAGTFTFNANVTEITYYQLGISSPYTRQVAYTLTNNAGGTGVPTCEYSVNDIVCDLCIVPSDGDTCTVFDCTNTIPDAQAGNSCDHEYPLPVMGDLVAVNVACVDATKISYNCLFGDELLDRTCDCTGIDYDTFTGSFLCDYLAVTCIDAANSTCATSFLSYNRSLEGETVGQRCFDLFTPYERSWCYETDSLRPDSLTCSVDGIDCTSCFADYEAKCLSFDCTNTAVENAGTCGYILPGVDAILGLTPAPVTPSPVTTASPIATPSPVLVTPAPAYPFLFTRSPAIPAAILVEIPTDGAVSLSQATTAFAVAAALVACFIM